MDGLTLTRKLKAEERTRGIRIVALTAFAMKGDDQKAFDAGCDGYITKPIDMRKLPDQVAGFLARASSQSRSRRLKQDPATKHIPIVAITSAPETFSKSAALAAGCDAYIVKPVDTRKLNAQVMNTAAHQSGPPEKE
jgi:CheY-like chemotaxis protein